MFAGHNFGIIEGLGLDHFRDGLRHYNREDWRITIHLANEQGTVMSDE